MTAPRRDSPAANSGLQDEPPATGGPYRRIVWGSLRLFGLLGAVRGVVRCGRLVRYGLQDTGWLSSARANAPVDRSGEPVPWFTYPAIALLADRLPARARIFEWGAGHSTLWFARRAARVVSVEADPAWAAYVRSRAGPNIEIRERADPDRYVEAIKEDAADYDVIVVDGMKRTRYACGRVALEALAPGGVIVWDNADWPDFEAAWLDYLAPAGIRRLPLRGFGPCGWREWETTILYREGNVLGI